MPRRNTPFYPEEYYHLYNRGNNRQQIFFADDNYHYFLRGMKKYLLPVADILAYCLMPTHYHLLIRVRPQPQTSGVYNKSPEHSSIQQGSEPTPTHTQPQTSEVCNRPSEYSSIQQGSEPTPTHTTKTSEVLISSRVSHAMQLLSISYTKAINKRYERVGSLFQGQFQGKIVQDSSYLRNLCIYISMNPVKDGMAARPEDWAFSSYREWARLRTGDLVNLEWIEDHFGSAAEVQALVSAALQTRNLQETLATSLLERGFGENPGGMQGESLANQ